MTDRAAPAALSFTATLEALIGLTGRHVTASVGARFGPALWTFACDGVVQGGVETTGSEPDTKGETIYVALDPTGSRGFLLDRESFGGAWWDGPALTIALGPLLLTVEPESASEQAGAAG
jgi:hypothetical protein